MSLSHLKKTSGKKKYGKPFPDVIQIPGNQLQLHFLGGVVCLLGGCFGFNSCESLSS